MEKDIDILISKMTLEEKASLCSGLDMWKTKPVDRLGIPSITISDGPNGLRKLTKANDYLAADAGIPSTCFPSGAFIACSWDVDLIREIGETIGIECRADEVDILLGPAVNIKRSPLCGRNFEYYSEDPYLSTTLATGFIKGIQQKGVGASIKHFAANNQEYRRFLSDSVVDERTLHEIYLASFEGAVKEAEPWTVMCSYNKLNGVYTSEDEALLTDTLRTRWGFEGVVISDWGAVNDRVKGLAAGLDLEMPSSEGTGDAKIVQAVLNGELDEKKLDMAVIRLLKIISKASENKKQTVGYREEAHREVARRAARESIVLLKNEADILPLQTKGSIAVIGDFAREPRYQGGGSSHVSASHVDCPYDAICTHCGDAEIKYEKGYHAENEDIDQVLAATAISCAQKADCAILFVGNIESQESEGFDRVDLRLPRNQIDLVEKITSVQSETIVVLMNASAVEMPWLDKVKGLFETYLGGQGIGIAIAELLFGIYSPCGKLAETFPKRIQDTPAYLNFPGYEDKTEYSEKLFVGYRSYEARDIQPLFPFGFGLSYTQFNYSGISLNRTEIEDIQTLTVHVKVKNTGKAAGKEIVQLYVRAVESFVCRPLKELKGYQKIELAAGEEKVVEFTLAKRSFAYYNIEMKDWHVESGNYDILIGSSSTTILQKATVRVLSTQHRKKTYTINSTVGDIMKHPYGVAFMAQINKPDKTKANNALTEVVQVMWNDLPLRAIVSFSQGRITEKMTDALLEQLNQET